MSIITQVNKSMVITDVYFCMTKFCKTKSHRALCVCNLFHILKLIRCWKKSKIIKYGFTSSWTSEPSGGSINKLNFYNIKPENRKMLVHFVVQQCNSSLLICKWIRFIWFYVSTGVLMDYLARWRHEVEFETEMCSWINNLTTGSI